MLVDILARKLSEMDKNELENILREFKKIDNDSYDKLAEVVEDSI